MTSLQAVELALASSESLLSADMAIPPIEWTAFTSAVNTFFETQPYLASFLTCSVKASAADILAQQREEEEEVSSSVKDVTSVKFEFKGLPEVDVSRNLGFLLYGGLYTGCFQCFLYHGLFPIWFGSDGSWITMTKKLLVDNFIFGPFLYLPVAYIFKECVTASSGRPGNDEDKGRTLLEGSQRAMETYLEDVWEHDLLKTYWSLWIPMQLLAYCLIPSHFRVVCGPGELLLVLFALDKYILFQRRNSSLLHALPSDQHPSAAALTNTKTSTLLAKAISHRGAAPTASPASLDILLPFAIE